MITDTDVKKLITEFKKIFPTKEDLKNELKRYATKEDLKNELQKYATKIDLKSELQKYATKKDIEDITDSLVIRLAEDIGNLIGENKSIEHRLQKVELKVFPQA